MIHAETRLVTPIRRLAAAVTGAIDNNTPVTCIGCHAAKEQPNTHGGHDDPDTIILATAACTACHDSQGTRNYVNDIHGRRWNNGSYPTLDSNCEVCHINNVPGATLQDYSGGGLLMPGYLGCVFCERSLETRFTSGLLMAGMFQPENPVLLKFIPHCGANHSLL
jgi:hypothetical protein